MLFLDNSCPSTLFGTVNHLEESSLEMVSLDADDNNDMNVTVSWSSVLQLVEILDAVCADQLLEAIEGDCAYRMWSAAVYANLCRSSARFPASSFGFAAHHGALVAQWRSLPLSERSAFEEKAEWFRLRRDLLPLNYQRFVYGDVAVAVSSAAAADENVFDVNARQLHQPYACSNEDTAAAQAAAVCQASEEAALTLHQLRVCFSQ